MRSVRRDGIGSPVVLVALAPAVAAVAGAAGLLISGSPWWALLCALLVPWTLSAAVALAVVIGVRRSQPERPAPGRVTPPAPRDPATGDQLVADLVWEIDLREGAPVHLPRQQTREQGRGAP